MARTKKVSNEVTPEIMQVTNEVKVNSQETNFTIEQLADQQKRKVIKMMTNLEEELNTLWTLEFKRNAAWLRRIELVKKQVTATKDVLKGTL